jgi:hypothetical protein
MAYLSPAWLLIEGDPFLYKLMLTLTLSLVLMTLKSYKSWV